VPRDVVAGSRTPVFLIHGTADTMLRPPQSEMIVNAAPRTVLWEVRRAQHRGAWATTGKEFEHRVLAWMDDHSPVAPAIGK
jgi:dipeptidyl aminopeptidase/acylaminoacyl peptidase